MITYNNILFLDIETVPQYQHFEELPPSWQSLWEHKSAYLLKNAVDEDVASIYQRAGIYAEFGKIICISCGIIQGNQQSKKLLIKSYSGDNEKEIILNFVEMLNKWSTGEQRLLCAHNGKEFDFPYLCRRMMIHQIPLPGLLQIAGKKPWEVKLLDTMDMWKFGDYKHFTSLDLLAHLFNIKSSKDDIDGSMVAKIYYEDRDIERIVNYCQKDVITLTQVYLRMTGEETISAENIEIK